MKINATLRVKELRITPETKSVIAECEVHALGAYSAQPARVHVQFYLDPKFMDEFSKAMLKTIEPIIERGVT